MAETMIGATLQVLVEKLVAADDDKEIGIALEIKSELTKLKKSLAMIQAFLNNAVRRQVQDEAVNLWLKNLENIVHEAGDLLDEFNYESFVVRIKDVNMKLKMVSEEAISYGLQKKVADFAIFLHAIIETDFVSVGPIVVGRENDVSKIVNMAVNSSNEVVSMIPVVGMGSLGKTTLVQKIFNNQEIVQYFDERI
ncbi:putative disease resistance protein RGA3 [Sesamum alatum]|uniref:Disease resistance protein RGA3 n=1 Tax=Sesamum alatum TaxID=300844 RepID=A0AAE2CMR0_9LAMI|nr:putative disease resistance protein RGA3 [Sesamum alatum]